MDEDEISWFEVEWLSEATGKMTYNPEQPLPRSSFFDDDGTINEEFEKYCIENRLSTQQNPKRKKRKM